MLVAAFFVRSSTILASGSSGMLPLSARSMAIAPREPKCSSCPRSRLQRLARVQECEAGRCRAESVRCTRECVNAALRAPQSACCARFRLGAAGWMGLCVRATGERSVP